MFLSKSRNRPSRDSVRIFVALALLIASLERSHAAGLDGAGYMGPADQTSSGSVAMVRLRVPFGGKTRNAVPATLTLGYGPRWQDASGTPGAAHFFIPSAEAGFSRDGNPILKLGSIDLTMSPALSARADGDNGNEDNGKTWLIGIGLGVLALGAGVAWLQPRTGGSGGKPIIGPLTCYDAYGKVVTCNGLLPGL